MTACPAGLPAAGAGGLLSLRSVNHISKVCRNVAASVAFYRDILGFVLIKRPNTFNETFEGAWLWGYGMGLHLIKGNPVARSAEIDPKADHLSFQADCLGEVEAQLLFHGIHYVKQCVMEDGIEVQQLFFHDPSNNMIEVCNCDCLPVIPLDQDGNQTVALSSKRSSEDEELSSDGSRDSMDSSRSEQLHQEAPDIQSLAMQLGQA